MTTVTTKPIPKHGQVYVLVKLSGLEPYVLEPLVLESTPSFVEKGSVTFLRRLASDELVRAGDFVLFLDTLLESTVVPGILQDYCLFKFLHIRTNTVFYVKIVAAGLLFPQWKDRANHAFYWFFETLDNYAKNNPQGV